MITNRIRWAEINGRYQATAEVLGWNAPETIRLEALDALATEAYLAAPDAPAPTHLGGVDVRAYVPSEVVR